MSSIVDSVWMGKATILRIHRGSFMSERGKKAVCISASQEVEILLIKIMYTDILIHTWRELAKLSSAGQRFNEPSMFNICPAGSSSLELPIGIGSHTVVGTMSTLRSVRWTNCDKKSRGNEMVLMSRSSVCGWFGVEDTYSFVEFRMQQGVVVSHPLHLPSKRPLPTWMEFHLQVGLVQSCVTVTVIASMCPTSLAILRPGTYTGPSCKKS